MNKASLDLDKVSALIKYSSFYKKLDIPLDYFERLIVSGPLLRKQDIQQKQQELLNANYKYLDLNSLIITRTSGSSGEPLEVYWNQDDYLKSNLCLWRLRNKYHGIAPNSKFVSFHSILYNKSKPLKIKRIMTLSNGTNISFSKFNLTDSDLSDYLEEMYRFSPEWMLIQPSIAFRLMEYLKKTEKSLPKSIRYIELNGEMISANGESQLRDFYMINISNMYGCNEVNAIGYECKCGNMHIVSSNVLVQLYDAKRDDTGVSGKIIVTSINNTVFPIVGYDLGDVVHIIENHNCDCGNTAPIIDKIYGRCNDEITLKSGEKINTFLFTYCIETLNSMMGNPIKQFKILKKNENPVVLIRVDSAFSNWESAISSELSRICVQQFGAEFPISIECVYKPIEISNNGKYKFIE